MSFVDLKSASHPAVRPLDVKSLIRSLHPNIVRVKITDRTPIEKNIENCNHPISSWVITQVFYRFHGNEETFQGNDINVCRECGRYRMAPKKQL